MTPQSFTKEQFSHGLLLDISIDQAWSYIASPEGLTSWFLGKTSYTGPDGEIRQAHHSVQKGDQYYWEWQKQHSVEGIVLDLVEEEFFAVTFGTDFTVEFRLSQEGNRTRIVLTQLNANPNKSNEFRFINCCVCWAFFLTNLKSMAEGGKDLREVDVEEEILVNQ